MGPHHLKGCCFREEGVHGGWLGTAAPHPMMFVTPVVTPELALLGTSGTQQQTWRCIEHLVSNERKPSIEVKRGLGGEARETMSIMS